MEQEAAVNSEFEKYIMSILASENKGKGSAAIAAPANVSDSKTRPVTINSILKRASTWHTQDKSKEDEKCNIRGLQLNPKLYDMIEKTDRGDLDVNAMEIDGKSRTELDSHVNMVVVGKNCYVIDLTGETMDVCPFTPEYESLKKVPLLDATLVYTCEYNNK